MYPYHNNIKKLLKTQPFEVVEDKFPFAYRFVFPDIGKSYPIRPERIGEYAEWLGGKI